jgi:hypothetical protein
VIKNCIDDEWANDLRFTSVVLFRKLMEYQGHELDYENFKEVYPELLKRLDDS